MKILLLTNGTYSSATNFTEELPAFQAYWGRHYTQILSTLRALQKNGYHVDYYIISITHGLIQYNQKITKELYDWRGWGKRKLNNYGLEHNYLKQFYSLVLKYDLALILLSKDFLHLFNFNSDNSFATHRLKLIPNTVFFLGNGCNKLLPSSNNLIKINAGPLEAAKYKVSLLELKSYLLKEFCINRLLLS